jgi:hypothetical protein
MSMNGIKARPAESTGFAAAVAVLIGYFLGIHDAAVLAALVVVVGAIPAVVTFIVELTRKKAA